MTRMPTTRPNYALAQHWLSTTFPKGVVIRHSENHQGAIQLRQHHWKELRILPQAQGGYTTFSVTYNISTPQSTSSGSTNSPTSSGGVSTSYLTAKTLTVRNQIKPSST